MYKKNNYLVLSNIKLTENIFEMRLKGDTEYITKPGQFINIAINGFYLRRPISVCDLNEDIITIIYKVVGKGTEKLSTIKEGSILDVLTGLGNGFDIELSGDYPLIIGGGVGVPPLYYLAKKLSQEGKKVIAVLGFNSKNEIFYEDKFKKICYNTAVTTVDGSYENKGYVTSVMDRFNYTYFYACGPQPMLKAVYDNAKTLGELSFEERMGCGFGACMGCTCKTKYGNKRICKDGPVLKKEEVIW